MGRYDGYLLCTDFDGTFALPNATLSEENLAAVKRFQAEGGLFTIASGRSPAFIRALTGPFEVNAPLIAMNGAMVCDENSYAVLKDYPIDESLLGALDEFASLGLIEHLVLWNAGEEQNHWSPELGVAPSAHYAAHPRPWYKAVLAHSGEKATLAAKDHFNARWSGRFSGRRSWATGFEILAKDCGKGAALKWIREYLGGRVHTVVGVGDYENDVSLVREADIGYAVANALPEVRAAADRVTVSNSEHAIAAVIRELERDL